MRLRWVVKSCSVFMKPEMLALLKDLAAVLEKHGGGLGYSTADNGIHVSIGDRWDQRTVCIGWPHHGNVAEIHRIIQASESPLVARAAPDGTHYLTDEDAPEASIVSTWGKKRQLRLLIERDGLRCIWCKRLCNPSLSPSADAFPTKEHIIRRADGGSNRMSNLKVACRKCNNHRH